MCSCPEGTAAESGDPACVLIPTTIPTLIPTPDSTPDPSSDPSFEDPLTWLQLPALILWVCIVVFLLFMDVVDDRRDPPILKNKTINKVFLNNLDLFSSQKERQRIERSKSNCNSHVRIFRIEGGKDPIVVARSRT